MTTSAKIYTIGYATKALDNFIQQLKRYRIDVVADVRSVPYSKVFHDYHREAIQGALKQHGIRYVYLGDELGPRSKEPSHYDDSGQVQFDRLMQAPLFKDGIERLFNGLDKGFSIALMCAEKDPATCHRSLLIGYFLEHYQNAKKLEILHIDHFGELEQQDQLEQRLCQHHGIEMDLFMSAEERQQQAYQLQLKQTSYRKPIE